MIRVQIGAGQLGKFEKKLAKELQSATLRALHSVGKQAVMMLAGASRGIKDRGTYGASWRYKAAFNRLYVDNIAPHAIFVERGRKPGRMPPVAIIEAWAVRRGLPASAAWPIARAIGRRGIAARPVLLRDDMQRGMASVFQAAMYGAFGDAARKATL